jgi:hypothetical protein
MNVGASIFRFSSWLHWRHEGFRFSGVRFPPLERATAWSAQHGCAPLSASDARSARGGRNSRSSLPRNYGFDRIAALFQGLQQRHALAAVSPEVRARARVGLSTRHAPPRKSMAPSGEGKRAFPPNWSRINRMRRRIPYRLVPVSPARSKESPVLTSSARPVQRPSGQR